MTRSDPPSNPPASPAVRPKGRIRFFLPRLVPPAKGGGPNWRRTLYGVWAAQLLVIMGFSMRAPFLPMYFSELGVKTAEGQAAWTGLMLSLGAGMMAFTSPIWGAIADKYGRKPMLVRAQFAAFATISLSALATSPWHLLSLRLVEGAMTGTVAAATALIAVSMPRDRLGYGLGMVQTAVFSGSALGPLLGGVLADWLGYRTTFVISGSMAFAAGVITLVVVEETFVRPTAAEKAKNGGESTWKFVLGPTLLALTMSMLLIRFASSAVQPITPIFVQMISHTTAAVNTLSGLTLGVLGVTSAISSIYLGKLGDKRGHFRILLWCSIGAGVVYLPMAAAQHPWHLIGLQAIFGLFAGGLIPAANALIASHTDDARRGVVFGFMNTAGSVGGFAGPLAGAALATSFGIRATFVLTGVVLLLMAFALWANNRRRPMEASPDRG